MSIVERQLSQLLREANLAIRAAMRETLNDLDLTPVQRTVLHFVAAEPGSSSAELARRMRVTPQTMHKIVADLERRELLALQPRAGHGRILDARLTGQGEELLADTQVLAQAIEDRMTAGLDKKQRQQLADLLQECVTALATPAETDRSGPGKPSG